MRSSASSVTSSSSISTASAFTSSSSSTSSPSPTSPCAACKFLRRKCHPDCVFAPYFPPDNPQKFAHVHKVFGASNVTKLLNELSPYQREDAVNSLAYEADMRLRDPIYGCVGVISILEQQLRQLQIDLARAKYELSKYQTAAATPGVDFFGLGRNNYETAEIGSGNFGFQFQKPSTTTGVIDEKQNFRPSLN
ncbi:Protein LATERAL ORGAN BOUNDARIES [Zostera marina]|uniref:Protein LATERAL ORGAN BOUNDARIES n=1 Tax=Zostera marina TaxID=29655 RepID=A0A0K9PKM6_ZOSMR|nr:Protein LATERAL ORGAN BOUNDARIES [Zostera marina]